MNDTVTYFADHLARIPKRGGSCKVHSTLVSRVPLLLLALAEIILLTQEQAASAGDKLEGPEWAIRLRCRILWCTTKSLVLLKFLCTSPEGYTTTGLVCITFGSACTATVNPFLSCGVYDDVNGTVTNFADHFPRIPKRGGSCKVHSSLVSRVPLLLLALGAEIILLTQEQAASAGDKLEGPEWAIRLSCRNLWCTTKRLVLHKFLRTSPEGHTTTGLVCITFGSACTATGIFTSVSFMWS